MPKIVADKVDWLREGYARFAQGGPKALVVEQIAKTLKCNKSSFYWHFKSQEKFIAAIVDWWVEQETETIIHAVNTQASFPQKMETFLTLTFRKDPHLSFIFFLKRYAQDHPPIRQIIDQIDTQRIQFTVHLFQEGGYGLTSAQVKASLFYKYLIGYHEMIRTTEQPPDFLKEVKAELSHFLSFDQYQLSSQHHQS